MEPCLKNTPGAIRTLDPLLRRQMLYPAELRTHTLCFYFNTKNNFASGFF